MADQAVDFLAYVRARGEIGDLLGQTVLGDRRIGIEQRGNLVADAVANPFGLQRGSLGGRRGELIDPLQMPLENRFDARALLASGGGEIVERSLQSRGRLRCGGAPARLGSPPPPPSPARPATPSAPRAAPGRRIESALQRPVGRREPFQNILIHPYVRRALDLADRQMEGQRATAEPLRRQAARLRLDRVMAVRHANANIEVAGVDAPGLPRPTDIALAALRASETGHALEHGIRVLCCALGNSGRLSLGHGLSRCPQCCAGGGFRPLRGGVSIVQIADVANESRASRAGFRLASLPGEA